MEPEDFSNVKQHTATFVWFTRASHYTTLHYKHYKHALGPTHTAWAAVSSAGLETETAKLLCPYLLILEQHYTVLLKTEGEAPV